MKLEPKAPEQTGFVPYTATPPSGGRLDDLPAPRASRSGGKLGCLALLVLLLVAGAAVWLTRDDATRDAWRREALSWLGGSSLAPLGNLLHETPPPPPPSVAAPATEPGTLAGPVIQSTVSALVRTDLVTPGAVAPAGEGQAAQPRQYPADSRVQPAFVEDLAGHVLERFRGNGLDLSLPTLNQRYGVKLTGLAGGSRAAVLRYAFHPDMLRSLYAIYADRFLDSLGCQCAQHGWSELQQRQLHLALAGRLNAWAAALDGVAAVPGLAQRLAESERLLQGSLDIYSQMAGTVFELDEARQRGDAAGMATAQLRVDDITGRYRQALDARSAAQHALVGEIRRHAGAALDEETLLFVAQWVGRRLHEDGNALVTVRAGAAALRDMAARCTRIGSGEAAVGQNAPSTARDALSDAPLRPGPKEARPRPAAAPAPAASPAGALEAPAGTPAAAAAAPVTASGPAPAAAGIPAAPSAAGGASPAAPTLPVQPATQPAAPAPAPATVSVPSTGPASSAGPAAPAAVPAPAGGTLPATTGAPSAVPSPLPAPASVPAAAAGTAPVASPSPLPSAPAPAAPGQAVAPSAHGGAAVSGPVVPAPSDGTPPAFPPARLPDARPAAASPAPAAPSVPSVAPAVPAADKDAAAAPAPAAPPVPSRPASGGRK